MSGRITSVEPRSRAAAAGLKSGDTLLTVNGKEINDVLDYKFYTYDCSLELTYLTHDGERKSVRLRKREGEDLGLEFQSYLMDDMRSCCNKCVFCFVDQMPKGMRETLYIKDDDSRLSFLLGNYVTLTNLTEKEFVRIMDMKISPLCVSVQATEPELRAKLLGIPGAARGYEQLKRLANAGIELHCQIVVCPGLNDKEHLVRTLSDLAALGEAVSSVSVIPVGLTKYREGLTELKPVGETEAREIIAITEEAASRMKESRGVRVFFCSDELYIRAKLPLPDYDNYEEFEQLENGVGLIRLLEHEFSEALKLEDGREVKRNLSIATGLAAAPYIESLVKKAEEQFPGLHCAVWPIENRLFGEGVDVAGLITGQDLLDGLAGKKLGEALLIPQVMLRSGEDVFLDSVSVSEVSTKLGVPLIEVPNDGFELLDKLLGIEY